MDEKKISKWELWRNQTLVNRVKDNTTIAVEYYTLIKYIVNSYDGRMETIQNPLLHLISHCIELSYKGLIEYANNCGYLRTDFTKLQHSHKLSYLQPKVIRIFRKLASEHFCSDSDKVLFSKTFIDSHKRLVKILKTDVITYRYAYNISTNKNGGVKFTADSFKSDMDSPNIIEVSKLFETCYDSVAYSAYLLDMMFPEMV